MENTVRETQQATTTQPEENGTQAEKTFTQEEVNRIISERLSRERAKAEPTEEEKRLANLEARENKIVCKEFIKEKKYPEALLDIYDTSNAETFVQNVNKLLKAFPCIVEPISNPVRPTTISGSGKTPSDEIFANIFKPKK